MTGWPTSDEGAGVPAVEVGQLLPRLDRGEGLLLLDVRNDEEFETWRIEARRPIDTVHVPYYDFIEDPKGSTAKVPQGREVVVLCAHGGSSRMVAGLLREAGIASSNVRGGMIAYGAYLEPVRVPQRADEADRFEIWQVNRRGKGCLSYVVRAGADAVVVDASRHVAWYEAFAARLQARIVRVLDTHVHADHVSGGPALARRLDVPYFVAVGGGVETSHQVTALQDGETLRLGGEKGVELEVRVISTPGHTPGSTSYLVGRRYLLTGDTVFVAGVGRPDLGGHVAEWGRTLFHTLNTRLAEVSDDTFILPAHYTQAAEIAPEGVVWARLGELRRTVPELRIPTADEFVEALRRAVKNPPEAYAEIIRVNLGAPASPEKIEEWELGKNQCAGGGGVAATA
jgi:glyoxylase-like metal-dependent hydrolase (beta-lactamase superfamily II)